MKLVYAMDGQSKRNFKEEGFRRRLAAAASPSDIARLTVVLLAETKEHGQNLIAKLEAAIADGGLKGGLHAEGLKHVKEVKSTGLEIFGAEMLPKFYPAVGGPNAEDLVAVSLVVAKEVKKKHVAGIVFGVLFAVAVVVAVVACIVYRRRQMRYWKKADDPTSNVIDGERASLLFFLAARSRPSISHPVVWGGRKGFSKRCLISSVTERGEANAASASVRSWKGGVF